MEIQNSSICKICGNIATVKFNAKILNKYDVSFYKCGFCEFIQTDDPYWLDEAYHSATNGLDTGYIQRNEINREVVSNFITKVSPIINSEGKFLDYGGGYGIFTRMMRDKGFDFYLYDEYAENIFAKHFYINDICNQKVEMLTAFEVFEHLPEPIDEVKKMLSYSDTIFFTTELQPQGKDITNVDDWWYFAPDGGQHISFFTHKALEIIAKKFNLNFYTNNHQFHILTRKVFDMDILINISEKRSLAERIVRRFWRKSSKSLPTRDSLIWKDFLYVKSILAKKND